jgi:hypothetical protein
MTMKDSTAACSDGPSLGATSVNLRLTLLVSRGTYIAQQNQSQNKTLYLYIQKYDADAKHSAG